MDPLLVTLAFLSSNIIGQLFKLTLPQVWPDSTILMLLNIHQMVGVSNTFGRGVIESKTRKEAGFAMDLISKMMDGTYWEYSWLDRIV